MLGAPICLGEKDPGVLEDTKLNMIQLCLVLGKKATSFLGCIRKSISSESRKIVFLISSALVKLHLEYCVQFWGHQYKSNLDIEERVQHRST